MAKKQEIEYVREILQKELSIKIRQNDDKLQKELQVFARGVYKHLVKPIEKANALMMKKQKELREKGIRVEAYTIPSPGEMKNSYTWNATDSTAETNAMRNEIDVFILKMALGESSAADVIALIDKIKAL